MARKNGGEALNDQQVQQIARNLGKELGVAGFKASGSWLKGWKGRCETTKELSTTKKTNSERCLDMCVASKDVSNTLSSCSKVFPPNQLTVLSISDKMGGVHLDECLMEVCEIPICTDSLNVSNVVYTLDYSTPEHNYSMVLLSKASSRSHSEYQGCQTPNLQSNVAQLLENVALLHAHEQVGLELTLGEGFDGSSQSCLHDTTHSPEGKKSTSNINVPNSVLRQDTLCQPSFLDYTGLDSSQEFTCPVPPSTSILEEEQLMSVFNHRSFTDPFPFLPTSFICCPPSENSHAFSTDGIGIDDILEAQLLDSTNKRSRKKSKTKQCKMFMSSDESSALHTSLPSFCSSGKQSTRLYSISPSVYPEHKTSPPHGSLLGSPSYPSGFLASSPPGGLLASRRSQPIFPDEPEIVFHELQLGSLHTTPTV